MDAGAYSHAINALTNELEDRREEVEDLLELIGTIKMLAQSQGHFEGPQEVLAHILDEIEIAMLGRDDAEEID